MTTIPSTVTKDRRLLDVGTADDGSEIRLAIRHNGELAAAIYVRTSDLHKALGIDEVGCGCDEADQHLTDALARAEKAEAKLARVIEVLDDASRADLMTSTMADLLRDLHHAVNPPKPFKLPTQVPARVQATRLGDTEPRTFYLWTNGAGGSNDLLWIDEDDWNRVLTGPALMEKYIGHRVLGDFK